ncbi:DNA primase family protein [Falsibacillus albus]|uniref:SF3 helicase domain-containing protein n=1 Tax=Falsibacillus albus TaxID=2478915 RepID=A0A3L7JS32_9BACI|nr:phage/plasmid primase, P4 family [Falsibacillus albus]RLQ93633.1 hypothetical protein D9X91_16755 [Falsibacillus albus]
MGKAGDFQDVIRKKINSLPIDSVSDEYLYDNELSDIKECENLLKTVFSKIPEDYLRNHEINFEPLGRNLILNFEYGELDDGFLAENSLDEEQSKVWDIVSNEVIAEKIVGNGENIKDEPQKDSNNKNIEYDIYSKILNKYTLKCLKGSLYLYNNSKGCFFELEEYQIRTLVRSGWSDKVERLLSKGRVDDIIDRLKSSEAIQIQEDDLDPYAYLINFNNCVLDLRTGRELNHSPTYRFTSFINSNYTTHRTEGKHFLQFIHQCTRGDEQKTMQIQELIGYAISNFTNAKKWFALIGAPHSGKSTILEVLTEIIGEDYTSNVPLHELSGRFSLSDLFKKKLNVCGELNDNALKNINTIKALIGNDRLRADIKYKSAINFINKAKIIMAGNAMPQLQTLDNTTAFTDRILFVVFNNTIPEGKRDYKLKEKLLSEKDYIVQWAVEGLERLINNNFIFTECLDSIEFKKQYQNEMSNINDFITVMCELEPNNDECRVHKRDLYSAYINYARDNCHNMLSKKDFFNEIKKLPIRQSKFRLRKSTPLDGFTGIALKQIVQGREHLKEV